MEEALNRSSDGLLDDDDDDDDIQQVFENNLGCWAHHYDTQVDQSQHNTNL